MNSANSLAPNPAQNHIIKDSQIGDSRPDITIPNPDRFSGLWWASWLAWPVLFGGCVLALAMAWPVFGPVISFNVIYLCLIVALLVLERVMPHEIIWNKNDGQILPDIAHTITTKGTVQGLMIFGGVIGLSNYITSLEEINAAAINGEVITAGLFGGIWPYEWPLFIQVALGLIAAELMLYWAHRLGHEWMPLWHFHAVHHSVKRLWIVNTGRFHFIDSLVSVASACGFILILGAPMEILIWVSAITAFIGLLTHCNIHMRFGPISWVFNTPELHRWHHSMDLREGDKNYGENLVIWDQIFRSYFRENRRPPADIGVKHYMPDTYIHQLLYPFRVRHYYRIGEKHHNIPYTDPYTKKQKPQD